MSDGAANEGGVPAPGADGQVPRPAEEVRPPRARWVLVVIVLVGLALRAVPIPWGTVFVDPDQFGFHPDEPKIVRIADRFPDSLESNTDYRYPLLVHDVVGVLWQGALAIAPMPEDELPVAGQPRFERATVFGRSVFVVLFGLGGMVLLALFTRRLGAPAAVPWVLAAFTMQSFAVANTALVQTDLPMAFVLFALLLAAHGIDRSGRWRAVRDPLVLGALLGAAVATKYTALIGLLPVAVVVLRAVLRGAVSARALLGGTLLFALSAAATFCAFVPGAVLDFENFRASLEYEFESKTQLAAFDAAQFWDRLSLTLAPWTLALALVGLLAARSARRSALVWASLAMFAAYLFGVRQAFSADWALPLTPLFTILSGLGLWTLSTRLGRWGHAIALVLVLAGWTHAALTVRARYSDETRYRFASWVRTNVEAPGPIGEAPAPTRRSWASARAPRGYTFTDVHSLPGWVVMSEREFEPVQRVHKDPRAFEPFGVVFDPEVKRLANLGPADIDFFRELLSVDDAIQWTAPEDYAPKFDYELVESFRPGRWALDMAGLEIRVYRRRL